MNTVDYTPQLIQAILIGSAALLGFTGVLVVQLANLIRGAKDWERGFVGILALISGISFIFCVVSAMNWFELPSFLSTPNTSGVSQVRGSFLVQALCFIILFLAYIGASFLDTKH